MLPLRPCSPPCVRQGYEAFALWAKNWIKAGVGVITVAYLQDFDDPDCALATVLRCTEPCCLAAIAQAGCADGFYGLELVCLLCRVPPSVQTTTCRR